MPEEVSALVVLAQLAEVRHDGRLVSLGRPAVLQRHQVDQPALLAVVLADRQLLAVVRRRAAEAWALSVVATRALLGRVFRARGAAGDAAAGAHAAVLVERIHLDNEHRGVV